jgi:crotonobetainyl-CoA:carnitine CoA-transferase CaiB-like acyl-CoA transferase
VLAVELAAGVACAYAGRLLSDLGATVVMVEPPTGSPLRERAALFDHLAGGKQSLAVASPDDPDLVLLAAAADVVLRDAEGAGGRPAVAAGSRAVDVDVTAYGSGGARSGWVRSDLALWALGGYLSFTGDPAREPVWIPGSQAALHAGAYAAVAALGGLWERRRSGLGQRAEVAELDSVLAAHAWLVSSWEACGQVLPRVESDLVRAADGWVYFMRIAPNDDLFVLIDRPDLAAEELTADLPTWFANIPRVFAAAAEWAATRTVDEIVELAQALRVAVTPVLDMAGVAADPQLAARGWWEHDPDGTGRHPGQPYHLGRTPSRRRGAAPAVGATDRPWERAVTTPAGPVATPTGSDGDSGPFAGLRVVEVTTNWAGPLAGRILGDLGADVVKVERAARPATRALFWAGPTQDQQRQGHHRSMYFNELNRSKRGVCLDLAHPDGRTAFLRLIAGADVLIENNSARVMPNLGLGWDDLRAVNPSLVMVSMSGYGASGPRRDWVAYGSNIETTCGLTSITGYEDGLMSRTSLFYADPVSGVHGTVAVIAALLERERSGLGQWIDIALNECGAAFCADALTHHQATGEVPRPAGNRDGRCCPHGVYRCVGADFWVAASCPDDASWPALATAIGRPDLAADPDLRTLAGRRHRQEELDAAIGAWTAGWEQEEAAACLQAAGVPAAPVLANWQMLSDPHLHARRVFPSVTHPVVGVHRTTALPVRYERTPARYRLPAPLFAEHNRAVLSEAGLDDVEVDRLYAAGVTADDPDPPA